MGLLKIWADVDRDGEFTSLSSSTLISVAAQNTPRVLMDNIFCHW